MAGGIWSALGAGLGGIQEERNRRVMLQQQALENAFREQQMEMQQRQLGLQEEAAVEQQGQQQFENYFKLHAQMPEGTELTPEYVQGMPKMMQSFVRPVPQDLSGISRDGGSDLASLASDHDKFLSVPFEDTKARTAAMTQAGLNQRAADKNSLTRQLGLERLAIQRDMLAQRGGIANAGLALRARAIDAQLESLGALNAWRAIAAQNMDYDNQLAMWNAMWGSNEGQDPLAMIAALMAGARGQAPPPSTTPAKPPAPQPPKISFTPPPGGAPPPQAGQPTVGQRRTYPNGNVAEWDGTGWVLVVK